MVTRVFSPFTLITYFNYHRLHRQFIFILTGRCDVMCYDIRLKSSDLGICHFIVCRRGFFGQDCQFECTCQNDAICDNVNGKCHCGLGWTGTNCEKG